MPALRHRPMLAAPAVQSDVDRAMIMRGSGTVTAARRIVGGEHAADKSNDREAVLAIIAQRVDVPPSVTIRWDLRIEPRSLTIARAARRPEIAAIGTPGPGCVLPPAR
jgi:hypothetical protein